MPGAQATTAASLAYVVRVAGTVQAGAVYTLTFSRVDNSVLKMASKASEAPIKLKLD